jgi:hypothetical protein
MYESKCFVLSGKEMESTCAYQADVQVESAAGSLQPACHRSNCDNTAGPRTRSSAA